jgi:hypothetical protein
VNASVRGSVVSRRRRTWYCSAIVIAVGIGVPQCAVPYCFGYRAWHVSRCVVPNFSALVHRLSGGEHGSGTADEMSGGAWNRIGLTTDEILANIP